jgi:LysR family transcriptional regulator, glycine cleavage system transcriptional activator
MRAPNHLNALRAFEAAARHLSYVVAGDELGVTPAAVGQLVRGLEETLGVELFHRSRSGPARLVPTDAARSAVPDLQAGFDHLAAAVDRLRTGATRAVIRVAVPLAFADKWLLPRIQRFCSEHPDYGLRIDTSTQRRDIVADRFDLGIRYGGGRWPGLRSTYLLGDDFFPVCHPTLVDGKPPPRRAQDLRHFPLVHDESTTTEGAFPTWRAWLRRAGVSGVDSERGLHVDDPAAAIRAAIAGSGVALGRSALVAGDLAEGHLTRPFGEPYGCELGYYVVHRPEGADEAAVAAFRDWLLEEAHQVGEAGAKRQSFPTLPAQNISVAADRRYARNGARTVRPTTTATRTRDR